MAKVVVVHGIGKQYLGPHTLHGGVAPALRDGMRAAAAPELKPEDIEVAFYGHWFRPAGAKSDDYPWTHRDVTEGLETDLLMAWWQEAARTAPDRVPPPSSAATTKATTPQTVQRALHAISRLLPSRFTDRFLIGILKQVRRYLTEDETRDRVQCSVAEAVTDDTRVLVAHSLGSVIAYEALCAHPEWPVRALVTLGSPLGIPGVVLDRLRPSATWPPVLREWTNICDRADVVALTKELSPLFKSPDGGRVVDVLIDNGSHAHDIVPHLTAAPTGAAVAAGLRP
ncbi:hypothetical protein STRCI_002181 [Streptomyces cinnabarinus]|uniref:Serine peptidase n=1 Tax=Streptomyces cinnabarinus TaxID=67287 RepID=A0ABY7KCE4_9ACTN|nr:hypothetical protein [Streptomyces cinnabarinus]WAZ21027.1 hypothetical protein STRCI_002181 [Streptomyces cinnabarinus]